MKLYRQKNHLKIRFHVTAQNAEALYLDEAEVKFLTCLDVATASAKKIAGLMNKPDWPSIKFAAGIPLLLWHATLDQLIKVVSLVVKTT